MIKSKTKLLIPLLTFAIIGFVSVMSLNEKDPHSLDKIRSSFSPKAKQEYKKARDEYFNKLFRNPQTNEIPRNIRAEELRFAKKIKSNVLKKTTGEELVYNFTEAGPNDVGGRTRALAVDKNNSSVILAGGVSGGIWKSTDKGQTWEMKSTTSDNLSVTAIAQDPREGHTNTWYYGTGEFSGNSASANGAIFRGNGLYVSHDNGETWNVMISSGDLTQWDSYFDYISRIEVSPTTGSVFVVTHGGYIFRKKVGENEFSAVFGGANDHYYLDLDISSNGTVLSVLSEYGYNPYFNNTDPVNSPGVYKSTDDGENWTDITPADFPETHRRSVSAFAPSNSDVAYVLTYTGKTDMNDNAVMSFYKFDMSDGSSENRSDNLPGFSGGEFNPQGGYNMVIEVKPDDEDFVLIGGTNLYRSTDGFATQPTNQNQTWIGGYNYTHANQHPDQHSLAFDPDDPNQLWSGHDGGLSYTSDITQTGFNELFPWDDMNNGYNVTQFYTIAIPHAADEVRFIGGTQDNGTPFFSYDGETTTSSIDISSGDGSFCYWGKDNVFVSAQNGWVIRLGLEANGGNPPNIFVDGGSDWAILMPDGAENMAFINPFAIDKNNEQKMFYLDGSNVWRHYNVNITPDYTQEASTAGWQNMTIKAPSGYNYSAVSVSDSNDSHVMYLGCYSPNDKPVVYRVDDATASYTLGMNTILEGAESNTYIKDIAINPKNSDEILVVLSNYNTTGIFYSNDGAETFLAVEGNLKDTESLPGPSIRSAEIVSYKGQKLFVVGTSTGLYSTKDLKGGLTEWNLEAEDLIGNVIVNALDARPSDGVIAAGTHGRGMFVGTPEIETAVAGNDVVINDYKLSQNYPNPFNPSTTIEYSIPTSEIVTVKIYDALGREVKELVNERMSAGNHKVNFNAANLASGVYIYSIKAGDFTETKKMTLVK